MKQHGFTLIELIVVIVILGILAAVALPRFIDLREEAGEAAASGVAGAVASASAINFSARLVNSAKLGTTVINDCDEAPLESILTGGLPTGYAITPGAGSCTNDGDAISCTVTGPAGQSATASVLCSL